MRFTRDREIYDVRPGDFALVVVCRVVDGALQHEHALCRVTAVQKLTFDMVLEDREQRWAIAEILDVVPRPR